MKTTNSIPQSHAEVNDLAVLALAGAQAHGAAIGLEHNTAPLLAVDYHDWVGNPATPETPGKQALLNAQLLAIKTTGATAQLALKNALFSRTSDT